MKITTIPVGELRTNCYLVIPDDTKETMIIDPGDDAPKIIEHIKKDGLKPLFIVNTHAHPDHLRGNKELSEKFSIPCYIGQKDAEFIDQFKKYFFEFSEMEPVDIKFDKRLKNGDVLNVGTLKVKIMDTPGHSPGGISLLCEDALFSGDTLFAGDVGRVDLPGGSEEDLIGSFVRLMELPDDTRVFPGHGPSSSIGEEKENNVLSIELGLS